MKELIKLADFDGSDYDPELDRNRLTGQILRIFELMRDSRWRTLDEIASLTRDPAASISAQLRNLRKARFGSHVILKQRRGDRTQGLFEYKIEGKQEQGELFQRETDIRTEESNQMGAFSQ